MGQWALYGRSQAVSVVALLADLWGQVPHLVGFLSLNLVRAEEKRICFSWRLRRTESSLEMLGANNGFSPRAVNAHNHHAISPVSFPFLSWVDYGDQLKDVFKMFTNKS